MIVILTGSTSGIGWETLKGLYPQADQFILPVRNIAKANSLFLQLPDTKKIHLFEMDLEDLASIQKASDKIKIAFPKIDLMINNAGGMFPSGAKTIDGLDQTFQVNHLGHVLLIKNLLENLIEAKGKIIQVSSMAHHIGSFNLKDLGLAKVKNAWLAYGSAKLYNILTSNYLDNEFKEKGLSAYSLHPGAVKTNFGSTSGAFDKVMIEVSKLFFISPKAGAQTTLFLSLTPKEQLIYGAYYDKKKPKSKSKNASNKAYATKLWEYSLELLEQMGY
ncbi:SDR family NAD(P)-dependent oxidoreductase [Algoriphagus marinus]|uniref:SDR family NAD(P)-dependent oxidoreductase n=1 Tax=Algoriphagus marinus TaxID=1925762 RepID=UPI00094B7D10|nr:SDR family NAD(P)-dependent oxidoreductase [Algoriphagus marinus]